MFGQRLKLARKAAGLSMRELAECATPRVSVRAISDFEADRKLPVWGVSIGLSKALGVPKDYLFGCQVVGLRDVEWRKRSSVSASDRAAAQVLIIDKLEHYLAIEDILELYPLADPFAGLRVDTVSDVEEAEAKAEDLRDAWNLGNDPIPSMVALMEYQGLKIIEGDLPDGIDGTTCRAIRSDAPPIDVILISRSTGLERKRFNLAHELAHKLITAVENPSLNKEVAMNRFAGAFLIPRDHLEHEVGSNRQGISSVEIMQLKRIYGVSAASMLVRLGQVGILSKEAVRSAFMSYARRWRSDEPEPIRGGEGVAANESPRRFESLVWRALSEQLIHVVRAAHMLGIPLGTIERVLEDGCHQ